MIRQNTYPTDQSDDRHAALHHNRAQPRRHSAIEPEWTPTKEAASNADNAESNDPPSKRRRVALACTVCRGRKSRVSHHGGFVSPFPPDWDPDFSLGPLS
jgi:hypothetical protein